jgi:hypothetical protein
MDEIKIPIQYGRIMKSKRNNFKSGCWSGGPDRSRQKWTSLQNKYRLEDAQTEPMISLIANDNWAEYTFVMWLDIKTKNHKIRIVYKNINWDWNYKWSRKDGLSDIPISAGSWF